MMQLTEVYVGLGGNVGDTPTIFRQALSSIENLPEVVQLSVSHFYTTTPVSTISQDLYLNAVCRFCTSLSAKELLSVLQKIEENLGKKPKDKNAPRPIDLDIILFGLGMHCSDTLIIPHPEWKNRLFVLVPLLDLTQEVVYPTIANSPQNACHLNIPQFLKTFPNLNQEIVLRHSSSAGEEKLRE